MKISVFTRSLIFFAISYAIYTAAFISWDFDRAYRHDMKNWISWATTYSQTSQVLLEQDRYFDAEDYLSFATAANQIHYYVIQKDGKTVSYSNQASTEEMAQFVLSVPNIYSNDNVRYVVTKAGEYTVLIGHKVSMAAYWGFYWRERALMQVYDFFTLIFGAVSLMLLAFKDLRIILKRLATRGAKRGDFSLGTSKETLTLVRGLSGFEGQAEALKAEKDTFRTQVLPALRRELESGKKPPYEFACTLVRTDVNNFTQVFMSEKRSQFMESVNEFFMGVTHLVSRYNGFVYEFVGDEVLFYFKDEDHESSSATAIAALRDIHKFAMRLNEKTQDNGYTFKIKSSVAHGLLRFGPLVNAHALAGPPLIETVRMLAHVHEKSENTVLFDESLSDVVTDLCRSRRQQVVMLKGLQGARALVTLEAFTPLSLHLRQQDPDSLKLASYYRDDEDICEILKFVSENFAKIESTELNQLVSLFRKYTVGKTSPEVRRAYLDCLNVLSHAREHNEKDVFLYASLVSAANHILTKNEWQGEVRFAMFGCLSHPNRRVVANALDIFASFEPEAADDIFTNLAKSGDNRIEANSLVKEAKREWKKKTAMWLRTMMKAPTPYSKASALYALGEISKHFKETDPVAFSSDADLQSLLEMIPKLTEHANPMVQRQALAALAKAGLAKAAPVQTTSTNVVPLRKTS